MSKGGGGGGGEGQPSFSDEGRGLGGLEQLSEQFVLEGHEVQVLELEYLVVEGVAVRLRQHDQRSAAAVTQHSTFSYLNEVSERVFGVADGVGADEEEVSAFWREKVVMESRTS